MRESAGTGDPIEPGGDESEEVIDCVCCHRPIRGRVRTVGGRPYCAEHYARATLGSRGTWPSLLAMLVGLIALGLLMVAFGSRVSDSLDDRSLVFIGLILAIVPTLLWLGVFRELDRLEPEPHQYLLSVMILAALLTGTVAEPLRRDAFALHIWQPDAWYWSIPVHAMIQGVIQATVVYVTVRYTVFLSDEFDERADGIIYGTAAGLGSATLLNFHYVLDHPGLQLDVGTARIIVAALVLGSLGGLVGYGLGQVKFERHAPWFAAQFVAAAALLNGTFDWLVTEFSRRQFGIAGWPTVLAAGVFALIVLGILYGLLEHAVRETRAGVNRTLVSTGEG
jgi:RsiW-degrading membrane proteinase PrsW (M82 family)